MCDIKQKTQLKTMTVYKAVCKRRENNYLSPFALTPIQVGKVPDFTLYFTLHKKSYYQDYQHPMTGHISGFARLKDAIICSELNCFKDKEGYMKVLKIKLGGSILMGTTANIANKHVLPWNHITYAGSEILSIEELEI